MISKQTDRMAQFFASVTEEASKPGLDLTTIRDIYEKLHLAATEPEGVTYAEVDVDGVPALWCMPKGCDANRVLLHMHGGGTVVFSMHLDRKAVGPSPRPPESAHSCWITAVHRNTSSRLRSRTWRRRIIGCSVTAFAPKILQPQVSLSAGILP